mgnify:CR=1 FL=1
MIKSKIAEKSLKDALKLEKLDSFKSTTANTQHQMTLLEKKATKSDDIFAVNTGAMISEEEINRKRNKLK